jgi:tetratricopeptide (TPR) repeat protein/TolB-like protein/DNA-binding winged helix-turn-helix (wHTH) protein
MQHSLLNGFYLQDLLIEPASGRVSGPGVEAHLKPKAVEVLLYLAERPFDLVERDELLKAVWGDNAGSSDALTHVISDLRSCCQDHASSPSLIQTVPRRGYRLLQQPRPIDDPETANETGVFQAPVDGSFIGKLMRRGVVQAGFAYMVFGWALIQVADLVTPILNLPVWLPSVITYAAVGGFPIVLVLAWMLERSEGRWLLDRGRQSGKMLSGLERNYLSILLAYGIAAVGALAYQMTVGFDLPGDAEVTVAEADELLPVDPNSIAVLKFLNIGGNELGEYFSQGLCEDILDRLARISGLAVSSRGDSWSLPENASSEVVRRRLRVAYYVEGSVRLIDDKLRVVAQLIETDSGFHVLSRSFDVELEGFMDVQREITSLIVANLRVALPEDAQALQLFDYENVDIDAYVSYRRGKELLDQPPRSESINEALVFFDNALEIDPRYPAAHAGRCRAFVSMYELNKNRSGIAEAEQACSKALNSAANLDVVYSALGELYLSTGKLDEAQDTFSRALDLNPNSVSAMKGSATAFRRADRYEDAERLLQKAIDAQPGNWRSIGALGIHYFYMGRYAEAAEEYRKVVLLDPDNFLGLGNLGSALLMSGDFDSALGALQRALQIEETANQLSNLGIVYYYLGQYDRAAEIHRQAAEKNPEANFVWLNLGDALRFTSRQDESKASYRRAAAVSEDLLEIDASNHVDLFVLAWATASLGDTEAARSLIDRAEDVAPRDPYVHYYKALIINETGATSDALDALRQAVDLGYPIAMLAADPLFRELSNNPQFGQIISAAL